MVQHPTQGSDRECQLKRRLGIRAITSAVIGPA
jgi:hypothetical protein